MAVSQQRIRGPRNELFVKNRRGVPMEEALRSADAEGLTLVSCRRLDEALIPGKDDRKWIGMHEAFPSWTGTMVAYEEPGKKLGSEIVHAHPVTGIRFVFPVPEERRGKSDIALVAEHPDFVLVADGKDRIVQAEEVGVVEPFAESAGVYEADPKYGLPTRNGGDHSDFTRNFFRIDRWVGLASIGGRPFNVDGGYWINVNLCSTSSEERGAVVEFGANPVSVTRQDGGFSVRGPAPMIDRMAMSFLGLLAAIENVGVRLDESESAVMRLVDAMIRANPLDVTREGRCGLIVSGVPALIEVFAGFLELFGKKLEEREVLLWR